MPGHIRIGAVFALAWQLYRRRYVLLTLIGLLQGTSGAVALLWRELYFQLRYLRGDLAYGNLASDLIVQLGLTSIGPLGAAALFLILTAMLLLLTRRAGPHPASYWSLLLRRSVPVIVVGALCIAGIALIAVAGSVMAGLLRQRLFYSLPTTIGIALSILVSVLAFMTFVFAALPAAALEWGGPLRAFRRSFALTLGQRWRLGAIGLVLICLLVVGVVAIVTIDSQILPLAGGTASSFVTRLFLLLSLALTLFLPLATLVIAAAYHAMVRLKDGVQAAEVGVVFE